MCLQASTVALNIFYNVSFVNVNYFHISVFAVPNPESTIKS